MRKGAAMGDGGNLDVVRSLYEALLEGDIEALLDLVDEEVELEVHAPEGVPFSGRHVGRKGLIAFFDKIAEHAERDPESEAPSIYEYIDGGDTIVALGLDRIRVRATGASYESWWVHVLEVRDRRIVRIREYIDTAAALAAFGGPTPRGESIRPEDDGIGFSQ